VGVSPEASEESVDSFEDSIDLRMLASSVISQ